MYPMPVLQLLTDYWLTYSCENAASVLCWPVQVAGKMLYKKCVYFCEIMWAAIQHTVLWLTCQLG